MHTLFLFILLLRLPTARIMPHDSHAANIASDGSIWAMGGNRSLELLGPSVKWGAGASVLLSVLDFGGDSRLRLRFDAFLGLEQDGAEPVVVTRKISSSVSSS